MADHPAHALGLAGRVIAAEATRYLSAVDTFTAEGHDPHAAARSRARLARSREAAAYVDFPEHRHHATQQRAAQRRADAEREHDRRTGPIRFAYCPTHGLDACPDPCPYYQQRTRAAGWNPEGGPST